MPGPKRLTKAEITRRRQALVAALDRCEVTPTLCPEHAGLPEDIFITTRLPDLYRLAVGQLSLEEP